MVRISDAHMSSMAYGTMVLHVSPEAAIGGSPAPVRNGDMVQLDVEERSLHLEISGKELQRRQSEWMAHSMPARGNAKLYVDHVQQAHLGADLDFLVGKSGATASRESH